ncbi:MAG: DinB family protein [Anaerolineaceae bacterium]|nr:DinB family protein [Anaerolineae bacterium]MDX9832976.1 DinB family protein [Anaerolineae bacterium]NLF12141.1 DinB family protein [Anaerolineaceae bacterium]
MNPLDVLKYGHRTVLKVVDGLPEADWHTPGVVGVWSTKDVIAHLASHEQVLVEILQSLLGEATTPTLDRFKLGTAEFNDPEVLRRQPMTVDEVRAELADAHAQTLVLLPQIPEDVRRRAGTLPWYGAEYDLEDYICYGCYGHKREHSAQIDSYRSRLGR